ncbi:hypothetical protein GYB61_08885 [bacterium]|nr:hypothetical protein [bacterium]
MTALIQQTGLLLMLKAGPQDMPHGIAWVRVTALAYVLLAILGEVLVQGLLYAAAQAVLVTIVMGGFIAMLLQFKQRANRVAQTLTAFFASHTVLSGMQLPAAVALAPIRKQLIENPELLQQNTAPQLPALPALAATIFFIWSLIVTAHILRQALDVNFTLGLGLAVAQVATAVVIASAVMGL